MLRTLRFAHICPDGAPLHIGETVLSEPGRTAEHTHDFWEFFLVRSGTVRLHVNDMTLDMKQGSLCLAEPADTHCFQLAGACRRAAFVNVAVSSHTMNQVFALLPRVQRRLTPERPIIASRTSKALVQAVGRAQRFLHGAQPLDRTVLHMAAIGLVVDALVEIAASKSFDSATDTVAPWLGAAMRRMELPENHAVGLTRLVQLCGKSQEHVTRTMQKCCGLTPSAFVNQVRLAALSRLLRDTHRRVLTLALECGFNNASYFSALFRARYGCTPTEYRRRNRLVV